MIKLAKIVLTGALGIVWVAASAATHLHFAHGSRSLSVVGHLTRRTPSHEYLLSANRGSRLSIDVAGRRGLAVMYHIVFPSGKTFGQKGYDPFDGHLTETGTYRLVVDVNQMATEAISGSYKLMLRR